ncbi:GNAT family N-acetyltransferase [Kitasatospora sp. NPDC101155]|uniref:GNAT family N-acetyltransferase n=1 Tax=Kitasatospora sp. NPDC101155 TaxID=3364097 RepID=UPI0037F69D04
MAPRTNNSLHERVSAGILGTRAPTSRPDRPRRRRPRHRPLPRRDRPQRRRPRQLLRRLPDRPHPDSTGRGIGIETTLLVLRHAFETVRLHRVHLDVYEYNERAVHAYRKAGFTLEGRARRAHHWDDRYWDALHTAALRDDRLAAH